MNSSVLVEAKKIFASIQFPSQPQILINIRQEINKPEPEFKTIAQLVNQDLALTAKVIKVVNSSFFGLRS
ncbi:HDOD domain-containing protein, partial [candidate division KSB1 bacterium]|nr:HDOD domain-containing protein [candidate division KSB1 bacterium]